MKQITLFLLTVILLGIKVSISQMSKPILDSVAIKHWTSLPESDDAALSNSGKYFAYSIRNTPYLGSTLVIQSLNDSWKKLFPGGENGFFSKDSKKYIFKKNDTLCFFSTDKRECSYILGVDVFKIPKCEEKEWIAYRLKENRQQIELVNILTGLKNSFENVFDFSFSDSGNALLLITKTISSNIVRSSIQLVDLLEMKETNIWTTLNNKISVSGFSMDARATNIAFSIKESTDDKDDYSIWHYKTGMLTAAVKVNNMTKGLKTGFTLQKPGLQISDDGKYIFLNLPEPKAIKPVNDMISLDVWSASDTILQSTQLNEITVRSNAFFINSSEDSVLKLTGEFEKIKQMQKGGNHLILTRNTSGDRFWLEQPDSNWLVNLINGSKVLLKTVGYCEFWFSPDGRYLLYYDAGQECNYFSYNLLTGRIKNISINGNPGGFGWKNEFLLPQNVVSKSVLPTPVGVAGWLSEDSSVLVYDNYDIWKLDLTGNELAINLTNHYGAKKHIKFRLTTQSVAEQVQILPKNSNELLLTAFNVITKENGFYKKNMSVVSNPEVLTMGQFTYYFGSTRILSPTSFGLFEGGRFKPLKAKDGNVWIVKRSNAKEAPNYYLTKDFKKYEALTDINPQANYNWLTSELVSFKLPNGHLTQGILYKPENFDSLKKYPLLVNIYSQYSHRVFGFPVPEFTGDAHINIPWFTSHGYLVFTPDIYFTVGHRGKSALNTVISAIKYLKYKPYVNVKKIGITGHSAAGGLVAYITAHSNLFAASFEGAGNTDIISSSLQLIGKNMSGSSRLGLTEASIGANIWERPDLYLENNTILNANKIENPLLIFHSIVDAGVPWAQGVELFIALRRLQKKVWMLQYDNADHNASGIQAEDLTIRVTQFFDHYLKDSLPPRWMTEGIQARKKGIDYALDLDRSGRVPGPALVSPPVAILNKSKIKQQAKRKLS